MWSNTRQEIDTKKISHIAPNIKNNKIILTMTLDWKTIYCTFWNLISWKLIGEQIKNHKFKRIHAISPKDQKSISSYSPGLHKINSFKVATPSL